MKFTLSISEDTIQNSIMKVIVSFTIATSFIITSAFMYNDYNNTENYIRIYEEQLVQDVKDDLKTRTEVVWSSIDSIHRREVEGMITREQAIEAARNVVRESHYNEGKGYFHMDTYDGINMVLLGNKEVEGKSRLNALDGNGKPFVKEIIKNGREAGGGYTEICFPRPNGTVPVPKLTYTINYDPYEFIVGTGEYIDDINEKINEEKEIAYDRMKKGFVAILFVITMITIGAVFTAKYVAKQLSTPIIDVCNKMKKMSSGDFTDMDNVKEILEEKNEIDIMYKSLTTLQKEVSLLIKQISDSAQQVAASSEQLTASSEQSAIVSTSVAESAIKVAESCANQFKEVESSSESADDMMNKMNNCLNILKLTQESIEATHVMAGEGRSKADNATEQMKMIKESVNHSSEVIEELGNKSKEIGGIIDTISDIAEQTNLLALNAAIEAAHAGEAGRGFAVVAEEIRKLAEECHEASNKISSIVNSVKEDTSNAVLIMNESNRRVESGSSIVNDSSILFGQIAMTIETIVKNAKDLAENVHNLEKSSKDINGNIMRMDAMSKSISRESENVSASTEELTASMHEIAIASESLAKMAGELQTNIEQFSY